MPDQSGSNSCVTVLRRAQAKRPRILIWLLCKSSWVSATLPWSLVQRLEERACFEGRSLSNLIARILEGAG
jgi:hypothetical protein